jgi:small subunit ribosomal protein S20
LAHSSSAKKRIRQNVKHRLRNRRRKEALKDTIRDFQTAVSGGQKDKAAEQLKKVYQVVDRTGAHGTMHKNTAARKKSRLAKKLNKLSAAPAAESK